MVLSAAVAFLSACVASMVLTVLVRKLALRVGLVDVPDSYRKLHDKTIALGGGIAVFLAAVGVLGTLWVVPNAFRPSLLENRYDSLGLLLAGAVIVLIGVLDDRFGLRGRQKLAGQVVAASILMFYGLVIDRIGVFGWHIELGLLAMPFTLFWLLGAVNALNLLDGIDGLATTVGLILSGTIAVLAALTGHPDCMIIALVFSGSLLGFLRFNFPPASIFLGDGGSMLIGLVIGALAIQGSLKTPGTALLAAPLAICCIPIFDSAAAILRRKLTGRSIYTTDRDHLHHRLLNLLGNTRKVLGCIAACCMLTSAAALASAYLKNDWVALIACAGLLVVFIATGIFGRTEFLLVMDRLRKMGKSLLPQVTPKWTIRESAVSSRRSSRWTRHWRKLTDSAEELGLREIHLKMDFPALHESFDASWERPLQDDHDQCWRMEFPLTVGGHTIGNLTIVGETNGNLMSQDIGQLLELTKPFEEELPALSAQKLAVATAEDNLSAPWTQPPEPETLVAGRHPK